MKIVAVASGKGGVGKSTVSLNVARALAARGAAVGLLDADVYGPDIPLMLGGAGVPVLGAGENMRGLRCPHCDQLIDVFPPVAEERSIVREVPLLGTVPLDPAFSRLNGVPAPFAAIAERVAEALA